MPGTPYRGSPFFLGLHLSIAGLPDVVCIEEAKNKGPGHDRGVADSTGSATDSWLERFWAGEREAMEQCYFDHFEAVQACVAYYLSGAEREVIVQDVFLKVISSETARRSFKEGSLRSWLLRVARNQAIDRLRARGRQRPVEPAEVDRLAEHPVDSWEERIWARKRIDRFLDEVLPETWRPIFELRFVNKLSQREAAAELGMLRTTLAYREKRIRRLLVKFMERTDRK